MTKPRILAFSGATRKNSFNKKLAAHAAKLAEQHGAEVTLIDLKDFPLPLYDGDVETDGMPENADALFELFMAHDAIIISSPEYNGSISGVLKNTIDWVSRPREGRGSAYAGKVAGLLSTSPGALGGLRALGHVRTILTNLKVFVIPEQVAIGGSFSAFNDDGSLSDEKMAGIVDSMVKSLVTTTKKLNQPVD
jgi:NAD(P)H-dependent FMN reductase